MLALLLFAPAAWSAESRAAYVKYSHQSDKLSNQQMSSSTMESISKWNRMKLAGTSWTLEHITQHSKPKRPPSTANELTLTFDATGWKISGSAGCNIYASDLITKGTELILSNIASGAMYCAEDIMLYEAKFLEMLAKVNAIDLIDNVTLVLETPNQDVIRFTRNSPR
ncbi:MAG: META domain-containing protein [Rhodoluna sp.]